MSGAGNTLKEPTPLCRHLQMRFDASAAGQPFPKHSPNYTEVEMQPAGQIEVMGGIISPAALAQLHPVGRDQHLLGAVHLLCDV